MSQSEVPSFTDVLYLLVQHLKGMVNLSFSRSRELLKLQYYEALTDLYSDQRKINLTKLS